MAEWLGKGTGYNTCADGGFEKGRDRGRPIGIGKCSGRRAYR